MNRTTVMTAANTDDLIKDFALMEELDSACKLIHLGFGELQNLNETNKFYFLPFQILSQGFERLMKCHVCYGYYNKHGVYPDFNYVKGLGHDLEEIKERILNDFFSSDGHNVLKEDKQFLESDADLKELLYIISEFGKKARYHNFDIITGSSKPSVNAEELWRKFENRLLFSNPKSVKKIMDWELHYELYGEQARYILIVFERFVGALSRQFIWGRLGAKAKQFSNPVWDFNLILHKEFGIKDYRKKTMRYAQALRKVHKRTWADKLQRRFNPNYKHKKITKVEYNGDWPFYADEIIVECREKHWCIVTINGNDYALNGSAKSRYKLENPLDAGMTVVGKSFADFIAIAQNL